MIEPCFPAHVFLWTVAFADTDAGGVVYYARYLEFAERARAAWLEETSGLANAELWQQDIVFVVRRVEVEFLKPARLSQTLTIYTQMMHNSGARLKMTQKIFYNDSLLVEILVTLACLTKNGTPQRIPKTLGHLYY
ncbi:MAG: YbgC/FadM family acyl-CoA thioesterase [Holosporales bacterium]|jgi:acyl-CoA thioester hydrolase